MHIHDVLNMGISDFVGERDRLECLFTKEKFHVDRYTSSTFKQYIANDFLHSKLRGTSVDIDDFIRRCSIYWDKSSLDGLLFYCEMLVNLLELGDFHYCSGNAKQIRDRIRSNISIILEKTGYKEYKDTDGFIALIQKDALAVEVIEDISDKATAIAVLEYNRLDMKGDLKRKKEVLKQIGDYLEPTLQRRAMLSGKSHELADDVSFCLNNLDIRHNNKVGTHKKAFLHTITDTKLEELYDDAYRSSLLLIEMLKQEESHGRIESARQQCKGTK